MKLNLKEEVDNIFNSSKSKEVPPKINQDRKEPNVSGKLFLDVNNNPTKKGLKIQFGIPSDVNEDKRVELTNKLRLKLNKGLASIGLSAEQDTDAPYQDRICFMIRLDQFKSIIKKIIE